MVRSSPRLPICPGRRAFVRHRIDHRRPEGWSRLSGPASHTVTHDHAATANDIFSCAVSTVGRSTHAAGTAGAHLRYIGRAGTATSIEAAHMPDHPRAARRWMDSHE